LITVVVVVVVEPGLLVVVDEVVGVGLTTTVVVVEDAVGVGTTAGETGVVATGDGGVVGETTTTSGLSLLLQAVSEPAIRNKTAN